MEFWAEDALCRGKHTDIWFPPFSGERTEPEDRYFEVAKMVCEHCPVKEDCRDAGEDEVFGVWGGADPRERQRGVEGVLPPLRLIPRYIDRVPDHDPSTPVNITEVRATLKRYSDTR